MDPKERRRTSRVAEPTRTPTEEPSPLEAGYRRWLRLLPAPYRAVHEQELVEGFVSSRLDADPELADATLQGSWPGLREAARVATLALRLRWAAPDGPRRYAETTAGLRIATLTGLTITAAIAAVTLLGNVLLLLRPLTGTGHSAVALLLGDRPGVWSFVSSWAYLLWIPALVLALLGGRRRAAWAAGLTLIPIVISIASIAVAPGGPAQLAEWAWVAVRLAVTVGLVAMAAAPQESTAQDSADPAERGIRIRLLAIVVALLAWTAAVVALTVLAPSPANVLPYAGIMDLGGVWFLSVLVVGAILALQSRRRGPAPGLVGLAFVAGAAAVLRAATIPLWITYASQGGPSAGPILVSSFVQLAAAVIIACVCGALGARRLPQLPVPSYLPRT